MGLFDKFKGKQSQEPGGIEQAKETVEAAQAALGEKLKAAMEEKYGEHFTVLECGLGSPLQPYGMATMKSERYPEDVIQVIHVPENKEVSIQDNYARLLVAEDFRMIAQKIVDRKIQPNIVRVSLTGLTMPPELGAGATWEQYLAVEEKPLVCVHIYVDLPDEEARGEMVKKIAEEFVEEKIFCRIEVRFYKERWNEVNPDRQLETSKWYPQYAMVYMKRPEPNETLRLKRITFSDIVDSSNNYEINYGDQEE